MIKKYFVQIKKDIYNYFRKRKKLSELKKEEKNYWKLVRARFRFEYELQIEKEKIRERVKESSINEGFIESKIFMAKKMIKMNFTNQLIKELLNIKDEDLKTIFA